MMEKQASNPYNISAPVSDSHSFFGREKLFAWLRLNLEESNRPIVLYGPPRIGKSSILKQIEGGRLGPDIVAVLVDLDAIAVDSLSIFLWEIACAVLDGLASHKVDPPELKRADFIADPYRAFEQQLLRPIVDQLDGRKPLLLFDNIHGVVTHLQKGSLPAGTLDRLQQIAHNSHAHTLFTLEHNSETPPSHSLSFLKDAHEHIVPLLSLEAAAALIRQPVTYTIVKDVAHYIFNLTNGHPYNIQQICHALYQRQQKYNLHQITVADVVLVKRFVLETAGSPSPANIQLPSYSIQSSPTLIETTRRDKRAGSRLRLLAAGVFLMLIAGLLIPTPLRENLRRQWSGIVGSDVVGSSVAGNMTPVRTSPPSSEATPESVAALPGTVTSLPEAAALATATPTATATATNTTSPTATSTATATPSATPSPASTPTPTPGELPPLRTREQDGMPMVLIPAGTFTMGAADGDYAAGIDEKPQHEVHLDAFYIDKYEVSVAQYAAFLNRLGDYERTCSRHDCTLTRQRVGYTSYLVEEDLGDGTTQFASLLGYANYPANHVSWYGADAYCRAMGARLPTEAEWEYAARGDDGRIYPWGSEAPDPDRAVFQSEDYDNLKPVDALPEGASPFGVFGMAGSVWEWTADWYNESYYERSLRINPPGPESGLTRALRGGAWPNNNEADRIRASNRYALPPDFISSTVGFRCAMPPE